MAVACRTCQGWRGRAVKRAESCPSRGRRRRGPRAAVVPRVARAAPLARRRHDPPAVGCRAVGRMLRHECRPRRLVVRAVDRRGFHERFVGGVQRDRVERDIETGLHEHNRALLIRNTASYPQWQHFAETDPWLKSYVSAPIHPGTSTPPHPVIPSGARDQALLPSQPFISRPKGGISYITGNGLSLSGDFSQYKIPPCGRNDYRMKLIRGEFEPETI